MTHLGTVAWRSSLGDALTLGDDDSAAVTLPFEFPFYAATHAGAFVNSDGNLTFEEGDSASRARSVSPPAVRAAARRALLSPTSIRQPAAACTRRPAPTR